ncbi:MAG TPA: L-fuculose-phosphate aldolase [Acidimicrobiales bacterium]|nr:L-fuculose-phosphate aldolase [Acidimicrobiales bacterium]
MTFVENAPEAVLAAAKDMLHRGLTEGTAGNISARQADGTIVVTPTSVDYDVMEVDDLVVLDPDGNVLKAKEWRKPTSEKYLHLACLKAYEDIGAVVHSHPVHATMFAVAHLPIPACIDEFTVFCGGEVRVSEYAKSGTAALADNMVIALKDRAAALIANHGMVAVSARPDAALKITALVERNAQIIVGARMLGPLHELPEDVSREFAGIYTGFLRTNPM